MAQDLRQYVNLIKEKDNEAFEIVYFATHEAVFAVIYAIVKDHDVAEDLMQDTYIKMIERINSYNPQYRFKTWLLTIARNLAIDSYRRSKKEYLADLETDEVMFQAKKHDPETDLVALELLKTLDESEQIIVLLRVIDEMPFKEIAKVVERPLGTVLWAYRNAMTKLEKKSQGGVEDET